MPPAAISHKMWIDVLIMITIAEAVRSHKRQSKAQLLCDADNSQPVETKSPMTMGAMPDLKERTDNKLLFSCDHRVAV